MQDVTYFSDDAVTVTSERLKIGEKVYSLSDVRYAGAVLAPSKVGSRRPILQPWFAGVTFLVPFLLGASCGYLIGPMLPFGSYSIPTIAAFMGLVAVLIAGFAVHQYSIKSGIYERALSIRLPEGFETIPISTDKKYLARIARTINAAVVESRNRKKRGVTSSSVRMGR